LTCLHHMLSQSFRTPENLEALAMNMSSLHSFQKHKYLPSPRSDCLGAPARKERSALVVVVVRGRGEAPQDSGDRIPRPLRCRTDLFSHRSEIYTSRTYFFSTLKPRRSFSQHSSTDPRSRELLDISCIEIPPCAPAFGNGNTNTALSTSVRNPKHALTSPPGPEIPLGTTTGDKSFAQTL
jgi:hypothetical protein